MFLAETRNKNKTVLDWADLEAAVTERRRLKRTTDVSEHCLKLALGRFSERAYMAQMHERLIAVGGKDSIELLYLHHSPGDGLADDRLENGKAFVFPAAGGRTQYKVCASARGHFMNRWLPFNAADRETKSRYTHWKWAWGAGGMYQEGIGPTLLGCGIDALQTTSSDMLAQLATAEHVSDEWRKAAADLLEAVADWRGTFPDMRILFETHGLKKTPYTDAITIGMSADSHDHNNTVVRVPYSLRVRMRRPCEETNSRFLTVPDLSIAVLPQPMDLGFGPKAMYALLRQGIDSHAETAWPKGERPARPLTTSLSEVMHVAREFSAASVYIPAL